MGAWYTTRDPRSAPPAARSGRSMQDGGRNPSWRWQAALLGTNKSLAGLLSWQAAFRGPVTHPEPASIFRVEESLGGRCRLIALHWEYAAAVIPVTSKDAVGASGGSRRAYGGCLHFWSVTVRGRAGHQGQPGKRHLLATSLIKGGPLVTTAQPNKLSSVAEKVAIRPDRTQQLRTA